MKKGGGESGGIEFDVREDVSHFEKMNDVRIAGAAELVAMAFGSDVVSAADEPGILGGAIGFEFLEELFEAGVHLPLGTVPIEIQR
jgi:hypothetical protein